MKQENKNIEGIEKEYKSIFPKKFYNWSEYGFWLEKLKKIETQAKQNERQRIIEDLEDKVERIRLDVDVIVCDCGRAYKDSDLDLSVSELEKAIKIIKNDE